MKFLNYLNNKIKHSSAIVSKSKIQKTRHIDRWMFALLLFLCVLGIIMVYESSAVIAIRDFGNQYYYAQEQIKWFIIGFILLILLTRIPYTLYESFAVPILIVTLVGLFIVLIPGIGLHLLGARRWIDIGPIVFQPSEISKLGIVIYLSTWLKKSKQKNILIPFLVLVAIMGILLIMEPDLGTALVVLGVMICMYFFSGVDLKQFLIIIPLLIFCVGGLAIISPYRFARLMTFLNIEHDPLGASYQMRQILFALGSGGFFGRGLGQSRQKFAYLPEANTDSIFAILGEELGFLGGIALLACYGFFLWRGFRISSKVTDPFGKLLSFGISCWLGLQTSINLAAMVALLPLTGIPLPFISYGGSSLILNLVAVGILLNISRYI